MARRPRLKGVKRHRKVGFRPKKSKKSVALRKQLKKLKMKREVENARRKNSDDGIGQNLGEKEVSPR